MLTIEQIIARLTYLANEHALQSMLKPQGKEAFDYGSASGRVKGLMLAVEEIGRMLEVDANDGILKEKDS